MNYKEVTNFITENNELICHITTWQTWGELNQNALKILFELIDNQLLTDYTNEQLYQVYKDISININNWNTLIETEGVIEWADALNEIDI